MPEEELSSYLAIALRFHSSQALEPGSMSAEQYGDYIRSESGKWGRLIKEAGITAK